MLDILGQNSQALNITATGFDNIVTATRTFLASAASLTLENIMRVGDVTYTLLEAGNYTIEARLNYQTMAYSFGQDLFNDADDSRVALFKDLDDNARVRIEMISSDSRDIIFDLWTCLSGQAICEPGYVCSHIGNSPMKSVS